MAFQAYLFICFIYYFLCMTSHNKFFKFVFHSISLVPLLLGRTKNDYGKRKLERVIVGQVLLLV